jgi:glutamine synthetase
MCRDSAAGIATSYGEDDRGIAVRVPAMLRISTSPTQTGYEINPYTYKMGIRDTLSWGNAAVV